LTPNPEWQLKNIDLKPWQVRVPPEALSKTFREAINIAKDLGVKYIWIDSLCIIQEGDEDFRQEAALMCDVYSGSYINIAASGALDGTQGCFYDNHFWKFKAVEFAVGDRTASLIPDGLYDYAIDQTTIARRAWCLQERILAPSTLYFGRMQLVWECNTKLACECLPGDLDPQQYSSNHVYKTRVREYWPVLMGVYSRCKLTFGKDKLIALAGVIRRLELETGDICFAGIWLKNIEWNLLWVIGRGSRPDRYRAPSWSWANLDGELFPRNAEEDDKDIPRIAHVLDVRVEGFGGDRLGELFGGNIKLICQTMLKVNCKKNTDMRMLNADKIYLWGTHERVRTCYRFDSDDYYGRPVYLLSILDAKEGLLLEATGEVQGQYRRIGRVYSYSNDESSEEAFRSVISNPDNRAEDSAFAYYIDDERYPDEHWVINIV
jgi:hypothetical protein